MLLLLQVIDAMNQDSGMTLTSLKVDGGMTSNSLLMQLQADLIGIDVGMCAWRLHVVWIYCILPRVVRSVNRRSGMVFASAIVDA